MNNSGLRYSEYEDTRKKKHLAGDLPRQFLLCRGPGKRGKISYDAKHPTVSILPLKMDFHQGALKKTTNYIRPSRGALGDNATQ